MHPPANLTAYIISDTKIKLSWKDTSESEYGFIIERRTGTGTWREIGRMEMNIASFEDNTISSGITYYYRVWAYNPFASCSDEITAYCPFTGSMLWYVVSAGGGRRSSLNYVLKDSVGQLAVGRLTNSIKHEVGFITGD